ncbi:MAG: helix-turn-helix domain-containing protein [Dokdonia sp.]|jgi:excisionase family DNA binding protein
MSKLITQLHNVSPEDFKNDILIGVEKSLENFSKNFQPKEPTVWVTRKQLKEMLSVSYVTIHDWCNKGILKPYKIGRQVRFKREEVLAVLENSNSSKKE